METMVDDIEYRPAAPGEERRVSAFVAGVYSAYIAEESTDAGKRDFLRYVDPQAIARRADNHFLLVATCGSSIVGAIEVRECAHVSLLFVDGRRHRQGIARELLRRALDRCRSERPDIREISVNSSRYAVPVYRRLGFRPISGAQSIGGLTFVPMVLDLRVPCAEPPSTAS